MGVEQFRADDDLVNGDRGLDGVVGKSSGKNRALNVRAGEPFSHFVGSWLLVAHCSDSEVITQVSVAVGVVGGLDNFNVLIAITLELRQRNPVGR